MRGRARSATASQDFAADSELSCECPETQSLGGCGPTAWSEAMLVPRLFEPLVARSADQDQVAADHGMSTALAVLRRDRAVIDARVAISGNAHFVHRDVHRGSKHSLERGNRRRS